MDLSPEKKEEVRLLLSSVEAAARLAKPWHLSATVGVQYDDNLYQNALEQVGEEQIPGAVRDDDDFASLVSLSGRYDLVRQEPWRAGIGYNHYQLLYFDHSDLNLIGARPSLYVDWEDSPRYAGLEYIYSHYWVDGSSRVNVHSILPRGVLLHGDRWRSEVCGGLEWREYVDDTPDSRHYFVGLVEMYTLKGGKAHVRAGYRLDYDDLVPQERADYWSHELMLGVLWPVWQEKWFLDVSGRQTWRDFDFDINISADDERDDSEQSLSAMLIGNLTSNLQLSVLFQHIWNNSNVEGELDYDPFHYRRAVTTCMLTFFW